MSQRLEAGAARPCCFSTSASPLLSPFLRSVFWGELQGAHFWGKLDRKKGTEVFFFVFFFSSLESRQKSANHILKTIFIIPFWNDMRVVNRFDLMRLNFINPRGRGIKEILNTQSHKVEVYFHGKEEADLHASQLM